MYKECFHKIVVWKKKDNSYYYKIVKTHYSDYYIGYVNSYGHEVVLIIDNLQYRVATNKKKRIKRKLIDLINKI